MSFPQMKALMAIEGLWTSPAQCAVMTFLCWKHREDVDYAEPSAKQVARFAGIDRRRVFRVCAELEAMEAIVRLAPSRPGGRQRFVITLDRAVQKQARGVAPATLGGGAGITGGGGAEITGGVAPGSQGGVAGATPGADRSSKQEGTYKTYKAREAAPRLPLLAPLTPEHPPAVAAAMKRAADYRRQRLRARVTGIARSMLFNPAFARELLQGESIDTNLGALVDATKTLCARKRVVGYGDVVHAVCVSELFKFRNPAVLRGEAPRPRDLARGGASAQHRANLRKPWR